MAPPLRVTNPATEEMNTILPIPDALRREDVQVDTFLKQIQSWWHEGMKIPQRSNKESPSLYLLQHYLSR